MWTRVVGVSDKKRKRLVYGAHYYCSSAQKGERRDTITRRKREYRTRGIAEREWNTIKRSTRENPVYEWAYLLQRVYNNWGHYAPCHWAQIKAQKKKCYCSGSRKAAKGCEVAIEREWQVSSKRGRNSMKPVLIDNKGGNKKRSLWAKAGHEIRRYNEEGKRGEWMELEKNIQRAGVRSRVLQYWWA